MKAEAVAPTESQLAAFAALTPCQRFAWYCEMLELCFALSTPATRERWREHKRLARRDR